MHRPAIALFAALALAPAAGSAQGPRGGPGAGAGPCRADATRLCPDVKPGGGALARCLREQMDALSPECRDQIASRPKGGRGVPIREACASDIETHCGGLEHVGGQVARCLAENRAKLSQPCQDALAAHSR